MRYPVTIFLMFVCIIYANAQESIISQINYQQLEKFIQLAKEHDFRKKIFEATEAGARAGVTAAKASYLDMFHASYYYRPSERPSVDVQNPYVVNGFQFGVNLNLSTLVRTPGLVKQAKRQHEISGLERREYEVTLENEVKSRYYAYVLANNQLEVSTQALQDSRLMFTQTRDQFESAEIDLETYNTAKSAFAESKSNLNQIEVQFLMAKDALEEIIGAKLTEIID